MGSDNAKAHEVYSVTPATADDVNAVAAADAQPEGGEAPGTDPGPEATAAAPAVDNTNPGPDAAAAAVDSSDPATNPTVTAAITEALHTPLIAVPDTAPAGDPVGEPLLVGGADLDDAAATLVAYDTHDGESREVLYATVTPQAEAKLLEALALTDEHKVAVTVDKDVHGRLPLDETHQLYDQAVTVAKSVNHHLKAGDAIPAHTHAGHAKLVAALDELDADPARTEAEQTMLAHYRSSAEQLAERLAPGYAVAYDAGGKVPTIAPYEVASTVQVTEMVPAAAEVPDGRLAAHTRRASRIKATVDDGHVRWDGTDRSKAAGHEYVIDLGDGYTAVYRPHTAAPGKDAPAYSHRGALEVLAPPGAGHGPELVDRLDRLNLVNRAMSQAEGEWAYLTRNITAQRLDRHPQVAAALSAADGLEEATYHELWTARADDAVGMDEHQLADFGRHLLLESEARALTHKVRLVRDAVAAATGHPDGQALAASPGYDPTPVRAGGWLQWTRFDVAADPAKVDGAFAGRGLAHRVRGGDLLGLLANGGVLASTERRRLMGVKSGVGASEVADMDTGGAQSVFLRVGGTHSGGPTLFWDEPSRLLSRADWYAYDGDHFGAINPAAQQYSATKLTREPAKLATFSSGGNEVMFHHGIDLLGDQAPSRIVCGSPGLRSKVLAALSARGITHLAGRPVDKVVQP